MELVKKTVKTTYEVIQTDEEMKVIHDALVSVNNNTNPVVVSLINDLETSILGGQ